MAWVLQFCHNVKKGIVKRRGEISTEEFKRTEIVVLKIAQVALDKDRLADLENTLKARLNEDGLLETVGRLEGCSRILVPRENHLAILLVLSAHERVKHLGVAATLVELRSRFWITKGRQFVKKVLNTCVWCKNLKVSIFRHLRSLVRCQNLEFLRYLLLEMLVSTILVLCT